MILSALVKYWCTKLSNFNDVTSDPFSTVKISKQIIESLET